MGFGSPRMGIETMDGFKFYLEDGSWVLIRPSGTEPIFRLYAESDTLEHAKELAKAAQNYVIKR